MDRRIDRQLRASILSPFVGQNWARSSRSESRDDLHVLKELIESGKVTPVIEEHLSPQ